MIADLARINEWIRSWKMKQNGDNMLNGIRQGGEKMYFHGATNIKIKNIESIKKDKKEFPVINFVNLLELLEMKIGFSFVSIASAKENLEKEMSGKSFQQIRDEATKTWEALLSKIVVTGATVRQKKDCFIPHYTGSFYGLH